MQRYKKITDKSNLEDKQVFLKTEGGVFRDDIYSAYWSDDNKRWEFIDRNEVTCREWNGEPTHYIYVKI